MTGDPENDPSDRTLARPEIWCHADVSLLIVTQRVHWRSCTHRDPPIQIVETKQRHGSRPKARGRLGGPRQYLRVDILPDVHQFAIFNGDVEDPMVHEGLIRGFDFP
jgi:hypothetical protein